MFGRGVSGETFSVVDLYICGGILLFGKRCVGGDVFAAGILTRLRRSVLDIYFVFLFLGSGSVRYRRSQGSIFDEGAFHVDVFRRRRCR